MPPSWRRAKSVNQSQTSHQHTLTENQQRHPNETRKNQPATSATETPFVVVAYLLLTRPGNAPHDYGNEPSRGTRHHRISSKRLLLGGTGPLRPRVLVNRS